MPLPNPVAIKGSIMGVMTHHSQSHTERERLVKGYTPGEVGDHLRILPSRKFGYWQVQMNEF